MWCNTHRYNIDKADVPLWIAPRIGTPHRELRGRVVLRHFLLSVELLHGFRRADQV
jgi:hypothetical protein